MKPVMIFLPAVLLAGCETAPAVLTASVAERPTVVPIAGTDLDQYAIKNVRVDETLKAYPLGRFVDPRDPDVMHESHLLYRREAKGSWNLQPKAPNALALESDPEVTEAAIAPDPPPAEKQNKVAEQNQLMTALIKQNEALAMQLARLGREMVEFKAQQASTDLKGKAP